MLKVDYLNAKIQLLKRLLSTGNESIVDDCWGGPNEETNWFEICFRI